MGEESFFRIDYSKAYSLKKLGHECLLNSTFEKDGNFDSCERRSAGKCINGAQGNLFWPSDSLLDHKSMESLHRRHFHKNDKERVWLAISSWPEGGGIVYSRKKISFNFHNIITEEGPVNNYGKRSAHIHGSGFER